MPYTTIKDELAPDRALSLFYQDEGGGPPFVMVHGLGADSFEFVHQIEHFKRTRRCIAPDLRGFGLTPPTRNMSIRRAAEDVDALVTKLGLERFDLMGHSMGTMVAFAYALEHPEKVRKLVIAGGTAAMWQSLPIWLGLLVIPRLRGLLTFDQKLYISRFVAVNVATFGLRTSREVLNYYLEENPFIFSDEFFETLLIYMKDVVGFDCRDRLRGIKCPTLIVHGALDAAIYPATALTMLRRIPKARLRLVPNTGHSPNVEAPELFNMIVEEFIGEFE